MDAEMFEKKLIEALNKLTLEDIERSPECDRLLDRSEA